MEDEMTTTSALSRRSIMTAVATIGAAAAVPALAEQIPIEAAPSGSAVDPFDRAGMIARAEQIVDLLSDRYIREGWHESFDRQRAAAFVESVRRFDDNDGECEHFRAMLDWLHDHGQSIDWLGTGDVSSFITGAAAASANENVDAKLIALGEQLKAASATSAKLKPARRLYEEAWNGSGFDKKTPGVRSKECERKFKAIAEANGYSAAHDKWGDACGAEQKIAEAILKLPSHSRIGDGVRAAATLSWGDGLYCRDADVLWEMAARAGFERIA
jgi:hypothetical protein